MHFSTSPLPTDRVKWDEIYDFLRPVNVINAIYSFLVNPINAKHLEIFKTSSEAVNLTVTDFIQTIYLCRRVHIFVVYNLLLFVVRNLWLMCYVLHYQAQSQRLYW